MITTDRNITLTCHVTKEVKESFRAEADRRQLGMSELLFNVISEWLVSAPDEQIEYKRSNKRVFMVDKETGIKMRADAFEIVSKSFEKDSVEAALARQEDVPLRFEDK